MQQRRGIALVEAALFAVIAVALMVGGVVYYQQTSEAARVNDAVRSIVGIQSGVRSLYQADGRFGAAAGSDLVPAAVAAGAVSPRLVTPTGGLSNEWAGDVQILGYPGAFVVDYRDVPKQACVRLAPHSVVGNGPAGHGIAGVAVNGLLVDDDGDGRVTPVEAEAACNAPTYATAMSWVFLPDANMRIAAAQLEEMLGVTPADPVTETGRSTETETAACPEGFTGQQTHSREIVSFSDGTVVSGSWSDWDVSACVAEAPVETGRTTETETLACGAGYTGTQSRMRAVINYSDGSTIQEAWSEFDRSACIAATVVGNATETQPGTCPEGQYGNANQTRTVTTWSDGSVTYSEWVLNGTCKNGTDVRTNYLMRSLQYSKAACTGSNAGKLKWWYDQHQVYVYYNGQTSNGPTTSTAASACVTEANLAKYRPCSSKPYGYEEMSVRIYVYNTGIRETENQASWSTSQCFQ